MNLLSSTLLNKQFASSFQKMYLDNGSLISLSSTSKQFYIAYREFLMKRMVELFNLVVTVPPNTSFNAVVMPALRQKIVDETNEIEKEIASQPSWVQYDMDQYDIIPSLQQTEETTLARRRELFSKVKFLSASKIPFRIGFCLSKVTTPASLHFLLSCARRLPAENSKREKLWFNTTGRLLALGLAQDGYVADALKMLQQKWPRMNACEQAQAVLVLGNHLREIQVPTTHQALAFIRAFVSEQNPSWAHEFIRRASHYLVEHKVEGKSLSDRKVLYIVHLLKEIASTSSFCHYRPISETYCETLDGIIDSSSDEAINLQLSYLQENRFKARVNYLKQNLPNMTVQEQLGLLYSINQDLLRMQDANHPLLAQLRAFIANKELQWAHEAILKACSFIIETRVTELEGNNPGIASRIRKNIIQIFESITRSKLLDESILDIQYSALLALTKCTTDEAVIAIEKARESNLFKAEISLYKQKWSSMDIHEQADALYSMGNYLYFKRGEALWLLPIVREFLADDSLAWASETMRQACSFVVESQVKEFQGVSIDQETADRIVEFVNLLESIANGMPVSKREKDLLKKLSALTLDEQP